MPYMVNNPQMHWTIAYLTHTPDHPRAQEISQFWQRRNIATRFLGYEDDWHDQQAQQILAWDPEHARRDLWQLAQQFDLILTHDSEGDYGHVHHRLVHHSVADHPRLVTFAPPGQGDVEYTLEPDCYDLQELPLHQDMVRNFHPLQHRNSYRILT